MGLRVRPLWNLLRARALKSLTSSSVDMSRSASKSTPLKLNFLNVLFFGTPAAAAAAASTSTSACKIQFQNQNQIQSENRR